MDCVEGMRLLDDCSVDLTVTSPPYDNLREYKGFDFDFEGTAKELYRVTKEGGIIVCSWRCYGEWKRNGNFLQASTVFQRMWI